MRKHNNPQTSTNHWQFIKTLDNKSKLNHRVVAPENLLVRPIPSFVSLIPVEKFFHRRTLSRYLEASFVSSQHGTCPITLLHDEKLAEKSGTLVSIEKYSIDVHLLTKRKRKKFEYLQVEDSYEYFTCYGKDFGILLAQ